MIKLKNIHILDAISVLIMSLLGNYIIDLKIDFNARIDFVTITRLILLFLAGFTFYFAVDRLKKIASVIYEEVREETELKEKAQDPDRRFYERFHGERAYVYSMFVISLLSTLLFFFIAPVLSLLAKI